MTTYSYSSESPADVKAGLLIVPVFQGPKPGPGVRETGLAKAYADAKHTGKRGEALLVTRRDRDRFAADAVLLVGVGPKEELTIDGVRARARARRRHRTPLRNGRDDVPAGVRRPAGGRSGAGRRGRARARRLPVRPLPLEA